jgi:hypothetical protein
MSDLPFIPECCDETKLVETQEQWSNRLSTVIAEFNQINAKRFELEKQEFMLWNRREVARLGAEGLKKISDVYPGLEGIVVFTGPTLEEVAAELAPIEAEVDALHKKARALRHRKAWLELEKATVDAFCTFMQKVTNPEEQKKAILADWHYGPIDRSADSIYQRKYRLQRWKELGA